MVEFITQNWADIVAVAGALHLLALAIVNITPSKRDNLIYNKVYKVIEVIAGLVTKTAKK
jgi:hypothetical protein